jgi:phage gp16-like protein
MADTSPAAYRRRELGRIHQAKAALGLDDDDYRDMLERLCGVRSAADLDSTQRFKVIAELERLGYKPKARRNYGCKPSVNGDKTALIGKIEAQLADAKLPWAYAEAIAKRVCKVDKLAWCNAAQLGKVIAALSYRAKRQAKQ